MYAHAFCAGQLASAPARRAAAAARAREHLEHLERGGGLRCDNGARKRWRERGVRACRLLADLHEMRSNVKSLVLINTISREQRLRGEIISVFSVDPNAAQSTEIWCVTAPQPQSGRNFTHECPAALRVPDSVAGQRARRWLAEIGLRGKPSRQPTRIGAAG